MNGNSAQPTRVTSMGAARPAVPPWAVFVIVIAVFACSIYANRSFAVKDSADYRYFPPFKPNANSNMNDHLGAEYFNIGKALVAGNGFSNPFARETGPTAWMAPVYPAILAGLLWLTDGNKDLVMAAIVFLQVYAVIATGILVVAAARRTTGHVGTVVSVALFLAAVIFDFRTWFQFTHDCWLVLLTVNALVAALIWTQPLRDWKSAASWGLFGGFCALVSPIVGYLWGASSLAAGFRRSHWSRLAVALAAAGLVVGAWTVRNYVVFERLIPVKSNAAYELYQSQCLQPDGMIQRSTFAQHPLQTGNAEAIEYQQLGEIAYLERKREQFRDAVAANPMSFLSRVADRLLGTTLWYTPYERNEPNSRPRVFWLMVITHPLPFLAVLLLVVTAYWKPLSTIQWAIIGVYVLYLLPYVIVSYYDRYGAPLLGVKVLLVIWGIDRLLSLRHGKVTESDLSDTVVRPARPARTPAAIPVNA